MKRARRAATEWRVAARLARREVRRRPGRAALVLLLIGIPVAGLTLFVIGARTTTPTLEERRLWDLGHADDAIDVHGSYDGLPFDQDAFDDALEAAYPPGSRFVKFHEVPDAVTKPDGHLTEVEVSNRPLDDPLVEGTLPFVAGRPARAGDEAVISTQLAEEADAEVGSTIDLLLLGEKEVTGVVADPQCLQGCPMVVTPDPLTHREPGTRHVFVDAPPGFTGPDEAALVSYAYHSQVELDRDVELHADDLRSRQAGVYLAGAVILAMVAVITTAAFAVAARRQLRTLGLLSAVGVPPHGLRRAVLLQGTTSGVVGSGLGVAVGLVLARILYPQFQDFRGELTNGLDVHVLDLLGPFVLGVLAATVAAWFPARTVARVPVLAALAGRKPQGRLPAAVPVGGLVAAAAGVAGLGAYSRQGADPTTWFGALSGIAVLLGGVALAPWIVSHTEPLARRLRRGGRVAVRDLARQRLRSGAVVAAVMAPTGLLVYAAIGTATDEARNRAFYDDQRRLELQDDQVRLAPPGLADGQRPPADTLAELQRIIPDAHEIEIEIVLPTEPVAGIPAAQLAPVDPQSGLENLSDPTVAPRYLVVNDRADLEATEMPARVLRALDAGKIVTFQYIPRDTILGLSGLPQEISREDVVVFDDVAVPSNPFSIAVVSRETMESWGTSTIYYGSLFQTPKPLTERQRDQIDALNGDVETCPHERADCRDAEIRQWLLTDETVMPADLTWNVSVYNEPPTSRTDNLARYGLPGALLLFTLLVVVIALALSAAESRDERALLDAVGAPPKVRRSIAAWQAALLPAMGVALAVPGGLAVGYATITASDWGDETGVAFAVPWVEIALVGLAIPLASAAITWLGTSLSGLRRRDLSSLALAAD